MLYKLVLGLTPILHTNVHEQFNHNFVFLNCNQIKLLYHEYARFVHAKTVEARFMCTASTGGSQYMCILQSRAEVL